MTRHGRISACGTSLAVVIAGAVATLAALPSARADEMATCVKASEVGQSLRDEGKYRRAREKFLVCSRDVCPSVVRRDCAGWLLEVDSSLPSVVISATDSGHDITDVKVTIDGTAVVGKLEGKPIPLDPGAHTLHYEHAGQPAVDDQIVVRAGEKNRLLKVSFGSVAPPPPATPTTTRPPPAVVQTSKPASPVAYVLGGVGVVGLVGWAAFGSIGVSDVHSLRSSCAPGCSSSAVNHAKTDLVLADVGLAVGAAGIVSGVVVFFATRRSGPSSVEPESDDDIGLLKHFDLRPTASASGIGGGVATFSGRF
jgi:hypothetical protein